MLNSFHGAQYVIRAATLIEQRPSGRHYERWQVRVEVDPTSGRFKVYSGGNDPFGYDTEAEAIAHFDSAVQ